MHKADLPAGSRRHGGRPFRIGALMLCFGVGAGGEETAIPPKSNVAHSVSSKITEAVLAGLPKYSPQKPATTDDSPSEAKVSETSGDILKLPKLTVRTRKEILSPEDLLTDQERINLVLKAYPGLRIGNIFGLNRGIALAIYHEEQRARKTAALVDEVNRFSVDGIETDQKIRDLMRAAVQRPNTEWQSR